MEAGALEPAHGVALVLLGGKSHLHRRGIHVLDQNVHRVQSMEHVLVGRGGGGRQGEKDQRHEGVHGTGTGLGDVANTRVTRTFVLLTNTAPWRVTSGKK